MIADFRRQKGIVCRKPGKGEVRNFALYGSESVTTIENPVWIPALFKIKRTMDPEFRRLLIERDEEGMEDLYSHGDCRHFVSVDWREMDDEIVTACAESLGLSNLTAEWAGEELVIDYKGNGMVAPLHQDGGDRHITVCTLNDILAPDYEIRFLVCSQGSDTAGYVALATAEWQSLEREVLDAVVENFIDPRTLPNIFTELTDAKLPVPARARVLRMMNRKLKK